MFTYAIALFKVRALTRAVPAAEPAASLLTLNDGAVRAKKVKNRLEYFGAV